jgi:orotidine-5'-phosphate decarboxylase
MFFLVPGYGAQGASAADLAGFFDAEGRGCIVNSSRGVIAAWQRPANGKAAAGQAAAAGSAAAGPTAAQALDIVAAAARAAAQAMTADLRQALG